MLPKRIGALIAILACFQFARWGLESLAFVVIPHTLLTNELVRTAVYLVLCAALVAWVRRERLDDASLPLLPPHARKLPYIVALVAFAVLFAATPFITGQATDPAAWAALVCGTLATPLFEELLFRGYAWGFLRMSGVGITGALVITAALFGLWHLGYADAIVWRLAQPDVLAGGLGLAETLLLKVGFATAMGIVLGYARLRSGGCLAPMLVHGFWNLLA